jgi:hypothetical protein
MRAPPPAVKLPTRAKNAFEEFVSLPLVEKA